MMRFKRYAAMGLSVLFLCSALAAAGGASAPAHLFMGGLEAYQSGDYGRAAGNWRAIADQGVRNGKLYYNLGNAYLKTGDLGRALLWYERALLLLPGDPDLQFNYSHARSLTTDAPAEHTAPLVRIVFFWKFQLSRKSVTYAAIGLNAVFWLALAAFWLTRRAWLRRLAWLAAVPAMIFILTAGYNAYESAYRRQAIVLPEKVSVRSGLEAASTELFALHAGAKVAVVKKRQDHYQIRYSEDKIGWVAAQSLGMI